MSDCLKCSRDWDLVQDRSFHHMALDIDMWWRPCPPLKALSTQMLSHPFSAGKQECRNAWLNAHYTRKDRYEKDWDPDAVGYFFRTQSQGQWESSSKCSVKCCMLKSAGEQALWCSCKTPRTWKNSWSTTLLMNSQVSEVELRSIVGSWSGFKRLSVPTQETLLPISKLIRISACVAVFAVNMNRVFANLSKSSRRFDCTQECWALDPLMKRTQSTTPFIHTFAGTISCRSLAVSLLLMSAYRTSVWSTTLVLDRAYSENESIACRFD